MAEMTIRPYMDGNRGADNVIRCQRAVLTSRLLGVDYVEPVEFIGQPALFSVSSSVECHAGRLSRTTSLSSPFTHAPSSPFPMCGGLHVGLSKVSRRVSITSSRKPGSDVAEQGITAQCAASKPRYMAGAACT
ncbi:hypothetical protein F2Q69_00030365 [Brassica cretica]|uniref:Uncharacterized protein n=1 Tax=Brassica cretica TaxID=69181 RepID=A0A8S9S647_BRACR|nr:hypothetical protein F2Q69_00030365 [Brassica cretica]